MASAWVDLARRNRPGIAALVLFLGFSAAHAGLFRPVVTRYRADLQQAVELGLALDPTGTAPTASARVTTLINDNSLSAEAAEEQGTSGALTAGLLDEVTRLAAREGLQVVATEQGAVTQLPTSVQVRAHLKLRGSYPAFVRLLGGLARSGSLVGLERFSLQGDSPGAQDIDAWVSQLVLKRVRSGR